MRIKLTNNAEEAQQFDAVRAGLLVESMTRDFSVNPGVLEFVPEPFNGFPILALRTVHGGVRVGWLARSDIYPAMRHIETAPTPDERAKWWRLGGKKRN